jgi:hypothetical protein
MGGLRYTLGLVGAGFRGLWCFTSREILQRVHAARGRSARLARSARPRPPLLGCQLGTKSLIRTAPAEMHASRNNIRAWGFVVCQVKMPKRPLDLCALALISCEPRGRGLVSPFSIPPSDGKRSEHRGSTLGMIRKTWAEAWNFGRPQLINNLDFCVEMPNMIRPSEHDADSSDGKLPLWAFALAAGAVVLAPSDRVDSRRVVAKREGSESVIIGHRDERGRTASTPSEIPPRGWKDILWRMYHNIPKHRVIAIAAGVTFYALLAIFPGIAALVAIYGLIADPSTISQHLSDLSGVLPGGATEVIGDQLQRLTSQPPGKLGVALLFGVAVSLWSARPP